MNNGKKTIKIEYSPEIEDCLRAELRQYAIAGRLKIMEAEEDGDT